METEGWKKCSSCKKTIGFKSRYYVCSVSTCNGIRTGYVFCSVSCFEVHLPGARHKDAAAIENVSPSLSPLYASSNANSNPQTTAPKTEPTRRIVSQPSSATAEKSISSSLGSAPREVLVIASRLKDYVSERSEMNTSAGVMDILSDHIRAITDRAIENARSDGRKTLMDRDFSFLKKS